MELFWIVLGAIALVTLVAGVVGVVRADGYGRRQPPASHRDWGAGTQGPPTRWT
jgi:hypothetical protein